MKPARDTARVFFIGAGPGNPGCLTLDGARALESSLLVYALDPYPKTFATLLSGKRVLDPFDRVFAEIVAEVEAGLEEGSVSFLIPGDLTVFSPFLPLAEHFGSRARVLPGVGIVNAAAALLGRTLDMPGISHAVIMTSPKYMAKAGMTGEIGRLAGHGGTMVLYMNNRTLEDLMEELSAGYSPDTPVAIAYRLGLSGERIYRGTIATIAGVVGGDDIFGLESGDPSMGLIIIGGVLEARSDPAFWDRRKKRFWDRLKESDEEDRQES